MSIITYPAGNEPTWPLSLPQCFLLQGFAYGPIDTLHRASMDAGLGKQRPKYTVAPWQLTGQLVLTYAQKLILDAFIKDGIDNGANPFFKADPLDNAKSWLWRMQAPLTYAPLGDGLTTTLVLDRLPAQAVTPPQTGCVGLMDAHGNHLVDSHGNCLVP